MHVWCPDSGSRGEEKRSVNEVLELAYGPIIQRQPNDHGVKDIGCLRGVPLRGLEGFPDSASPNCRQIKICDRNVDKPCVARAFLSVFFGLYASLAWWMICRQAFFF
jgi:hypothetical protein